MHTLTTYDIPAAYGVTFLTLLVREPRCIFAQWEVTESDRMDATRRANALHGVAGGDNTQKTQLVLRLYDVTEPDQAQLGLSGQHPNTEFMHDRTFIDIGVNGQQSRYITLSESGRALTAQIGVTSSDDPATFAAIAASNTVRTPPGRASDEMDANWSTLEELFRMAFAAGAAGSSVDWAIIREERVEAFSPGFSVKGTVPTLFAPPGMSEDGANHQEGSG